MYWKTSEADETPGDAAAPVDIEVAAYVLLALLASNTEADLIEGAAIVRWLSSQRNAHGGFASTQVGKVVLCYMYYFVFYFESAMSFSDIQGVCICVGV